MNPPLLIDISQSATAYGSDADSQSVGNEDSHSMPETGFAQLLANLTRKNQSGITPAASNPAEAPSVRDFIFRRAGTNDIPPLNLATDVTCPDVQELTQDTGTRFFPVDFALESDSLADPEGLDAEAVNLFDSLRATLLVTRDPAGEAMVSDWGQMSPQYAETQPTVVLKLESGDFSWAIPIEAADLTCLVDENTNHHRFTLRLIDNTKLVLLETDSQTSPREQQFDVVSRAELAVRRTVLVTDPVKLINHLLPDAARIGQDQPPSTAKPVGVIPKEELPVCLTRHLNAIGLNPRGNSEPKQCGDYPQFQKAAPVDRDQEEYSQKERFRPMKPGADARQPLPGLGSEIERHVKILNLSTSGNSAARTVETATRPDLLQEPVFQPASEMADNVRMSPPGPVKFNVHLADIGVKSVEVSSFKVSIQPEHLGQVRVQLSVIEDRLTARLTVQSPAAGQAVETNLPALKDALLQQGIRVEHFTVNIANGDTQDRERNSRKDSPPEFARGKDDTLKTDQATQIATHLWSITSARDHSGAINLVA